MSDFGERIRDIHSSNTALRWINIYIPGLSQSKIAASIPVTAGLGEVFVVYHVFTVNNFTSEGIVDLVLYVLIIACSIAVVLVVRTAPIVASSFTFYRKVNWVFMVIVRTGH